MTGVDLFKIPSYSLKDTLINSRKVYQVLKVERTIIKTKNSDSSYGVLFKTVQETLKTKYRVRRTLKKKLPV